MTTSSIVDDLTIETYALLVDQALFESEAVAQRPLTRTEAELITQREVADACQSADPEYLTALVERITRLVLKERGYTSIDGTSRAFDSVPEDSPIWRLFARRRR
jgi:hypothetical protein